MTVSPDESRVAVVTGAGTGLGRAIALRLVQDGLACILVGRRSELIEETAAECIAEGGRAISVAADVATEEGREAILGACSETFGRLDAVVNNAATSAIGPFLDQTVESWRTVFATNVEAMFFLTQAAVPQLRVAEHARVVNIGSVYGIRGLDNRLYGAKVPRESEGDRGPYRQSSYSASKGAVHQLTRELATALGQWGITVNTVAPGMFPIDGRPLAQDVADALSARTPLGRMGRPAEIGAAVSYLISPDASFVTGIELVVDGGFSLW